MNFKCETLSDDDIKTLVNEYRETGSKAVRDRLVMAFVPMASKIAGSYQSTTKLDYDDLQGEAILGVVTAISNMAGLSHNNIGGYVNKYVHQFCLKFIKSFPNTAEQGKDPEDKIAVDILTNEVIGLLPETDLEKQVLELKLQGYSDSEIGNKLGFSRQHIWSVRKTLSNRYRRLCQ